MDRSADYLLIQEKKIWFEQIGALDSASKPALVFLHEGLGSTKIWKDFPERLCRTLGLPGIIYDRQGHGKSDPITENRDLNYMHLEAMDFLPQILEELDIQHPILIGHSDGGTIALIYAAHYNTEAVITIAAHVYVEPGVEIGLQKAREKFKNGNLKSRLEKYHGEKTDQLFHAWLDTWSSDWFAQWNIEYLLQDIESPVLAIQGTHDEYAKSAHLGDITKGIGPNASGVLIPELHHSPHLEKPDVVVDQISQFIRKAVFAPFEWDD